MDEDREEYYGIVETRIGAYTGGAILSSGSFLNAGDKLTITREFEQQKTLGLPFRSECAYYLIKVVALYKVEEVIPPPPPPIKQWVKKSNYK